MTRYWMMVSIVLGSLVLTRPATGQEPGWVGQVIKPSDQRAAIEATPIIYRPYRPLHFYGNTVRRMHYHGRVLPSPAEFGEGLQAFSQRR